jgi:hypothetical protein
MTIEWTEQGKRGWREVAVRYFCCTHMSQKSAKSAKSAKAKIR